MANIQRYGGAFDDLMSDMMRGFWVKPVALAGEQELKLKVEVKEADKAYTVHAEIPGVKKDDIHVDVDGSQLTIRAEVKRDDEKKEDGKLLHSERYYGMVSRSMTLPTEVDAPNAKAQYKDGVLELTLPKKAAGSTRRISVA